MSSLFCCNFIQIYFYHLVKYIYENKDKEINELYDYSHIITIIDGEGDKQTTPFRFSIKILFMRLLYYNFGKRNNSTFEKFKKFDFSGRKITFREQFKEERKFDDSIPKLINYSKICLDDYNLDKTFEYIYGKEDKDNKIEKYISKIFYNLSYNSISFLADASYKAQIISEEERKNINDFMENLLKNNEEIFNYHYSNLNYYYSSIMSQKLFHFFENQNSDFQDENTKEKFLGILLYSFRISFISLISENKE